MSAERLRRRSARRPALHTEHGDLPAERSAQRVAEPAHRSVILEDNDELVGIKLAQPTSVEAIQPRHVHHSEPDASLGEDLGRA